MRKYILPPSDVMFPVTPYHRAHHQSVLLFAHLEERNNLLPYTLLAVSLYMLHLHPLQQMHNTVPIPSAKKFFPKPSMYHNEVKLSYLQKSSARFQVVPRKAPQSVHWCILFPFSFLSFLEYSWRTLLYNKLGYTPFFRSNTYFLVYILSYIPFIFNHFKSIFNPF